MITLETERLTLRNFTPADWQDLRDTIVAYQAGESARYEDPWPTSVEEVRGITAWFASADEYLAVCLKPSGRLIGLVCIGRRPDAAAAVHNLGYVFHPGYAGQGYATEGCRAALDCIFARLGAAAILTGTRLENRPSVRLLERLGLRGDGSGAFRLERADWLANQRQEKEADPQLRADLKAAISIPSS